MRRLVDVFRRYFNEHPNRRWRFFHNSFRVFLCRETARDFMGEFREDLDRRAHLDLAGRFAAESLDSRDRWEELYHRVSAKDHEGVCRLATQAYFREQVFALRPLDAVRTDIEIAVPSAAACDDVRAYSGMTLSCAEIAQRARLLQDLDLSGLLIGLGQIGLAVDTARDGNRLRVGIRRALELAVQLDLVGESAEARRLFELAEPLDLLAGHGRRGAPTEDWRVVDAWAGAVPRFRPLMEILDMLASAPLSHFSFGNAEGTTEEHLRRRLLTTVGDTLIATSRWADLEIVMARLPNDKITQQGRFWLLHEAYQSSNHEQRLEFVERLRREFVSAELIPIQRLYLAEVLLGHSGDDARSRELIAGLPLQLPDLDQPSREDAGFDVFAPLLVNARLLYQLGDTRAAGQMVPDGSVNDRGGRIWFLRDVVVVGRIWAWARSGRPLLAWGVRQEVVGIMQRFNRSFEKSDEWLGWIACRNARSELYRLLVRGIREHGADSLRALREEFEQQWQGETQRYWPMGVRRQVALAFAEAHEEHWEWAAGQILSFGEQLASNDVYDLVRETQTQAKAWIALGDTEAAFRLIQQSVRRAVGIVGEDYQFNEWLEWLDRLAAADRTRALGLLDWFARAVVVLRKTSETGVASSAACRLIRVATRLDPGRAVFLSRWLMDKGVIDHVDHIKAFLDGATESPMLPAKIATYALADLVVPFDTVGDKDLCLAVILATHREAGGQTAVWAVQYLARRVSTYAIPSARAGWEQGIQDAITQLGIVVPSIMPAAPRTRTEQTVDHDGLMERRPRDRLLLEDESELSLEEVLNHGTDIEALSSLARREKYNSNFDWPAVVDRLIFGSGSELLPLVCALRNGRRGMVTYLLAKSSTCREAHDTPGAWGFASLALEVTDRFGWSRRYGDGSRLDATRALIDTRPAEGRSLLWKLLTTDASNDPTVLREVLCQLRGMLSVEQVWPEIEDYLHALFDEHLAGGTPPEPASTSSSSSIGTAMARMLIDLIDHPVGFLLRIARRTYVLVLLDGDAEAEAGLRAILSKDISCRAGLEVLDAVSRIDNAFASNFSEELQVLARSRDATVAMMARALCERIGVVLPLAPPYEPLPASYQIILPTNAHLGLFRDDSPEAGQPWPDTEDPRQLLGLTAEVYEMLAEGTDIPEITMLCRGAKLMEEVVPPAFWSAQGERKLYERLGYAELKFTYRRPRAHAALFATSLVIGELWGARMINERAARFLVDTLRMSDPALVVAEPDVRLPEILTFPPEMWEDSEAGAWIDEVAAALRKLPDRLGDGRLVLAEVSLQEAVGRRLRTEQRFSILRPATESEFGNDVLIPQINHFRVADYLTSTSRIPPRCLVFQHSTGATDENSAGNWIAFSPALAQKLGWTLSHQGLFRWTDSKGHVMVESLWWQDGPVGNRGSLPENCVGEGWLVIATPSAMDAIARQEPGLERVLSARRTATLESRDEISKAACQTIPI